MKILFLAANPKGTDQLQLDKEVKKIEDGLERSRLRDQFTLVTKWAVDADTLRRALLKEEPDIVHFSGHGTGESGLVLVGQDGNPKPAPADALSGLFAISAISHNVKCILLNACFAEVQAKAIVQHIDYVIGMKQAVKDDAAIAFATGFYDGLGYDLEIEDAFKLGCNAIQFEIANFSPNTRKLIPVDCEDIKDIFPPISEDLIPILLRKRSLAPTSLVQNKSLAAKLRTTNSIDSPEAIQKYRERIKEFLADRELTPIEIFQLATLAKVLCLSEGTISQIQQEEQSLIKQAQDNYRQVLTQTIQKGYDPFDKEINRELQALKKELSLTDTEANEITNQILEESKKSARNRALPVIVIGIGATIVSLGLIAILMVNNFDPPIPPPGSTPNIIFSSFEQADAVNLVENWLKIKQEIYGPSYNRERARVVATGNLLRDIENPDKGAVTWLIGNNAYYTYSDSHVEKVWGFEPGVDSSDILVSIHEGRTLYKGGRIHSTSPPRTKSYRYYFKRENSEWKITDYCACQDDQCSICEKPYVNE